MSAWIPVHVYQGTREHYQCPRCGEIYKCAMQICPSCGIDLSYKPNRPRIIPNLPGLVKNIGVGGGTVER